MSRLVHMISGGTHFVLGGQHAVDSMDEQIQELQRTNKPPPYYALKYECMLLKANSPLAVYKLLARLHNTTQQGRGGTPMANTLPFS